MRRATSNPWLRNTSAQIALTQARTSRHRRFCFQDGRALADNASFGMRSHKVLQRVASWLLRGAPFGHEGRADSRQSQSHARSKGKGKASKASKASEASEASKGEQYEGFLLDAEKTIIDMRGLMAINPA